jgi:hypothetical protein
MHPLQVGWSSRQSIGRGFHVSPKDATDYGALAFSVHGTMYQRQELQEPCFAPGCPVRLVPDPMHPKDPRAIEVRDETGRHRVGYVPREMLDQVHALLEAGEVHSMCVWEWMDEGQRTGLGLLLCPRPIIVRDDPLWGTRTLLIEG